MKKHARVSSLVALSLLLVGIQIFEKAAQAGINEDLRVVDSFPGNHGAVLRQIASFEIPSLGKRGLLQNGKIIEWLGSAPSLAWSQSNAKAPTCILSLKNADLSPRIRKRGKEFAFTAHAASSWLVDFGMHQLPTLLTFKSNTYDKLSCSADISVKQLRQVISGLFELVIPERELQVIENSDEEN